MDQIEISEKTVAAIAASAERFIGYLYAGILSMVLLALELPDLVSDLVGATGGLLAALIAATIGIGIYAIYFKVIGEILLFPFQHLVHMVGDLLTGRRGARRSSTIGLLMHYGVHPLQSRRAYDFVKEQFLAKQDDSDVLVAHGELHVLYLTSVLTAVCYGLVRVYSAETVLEYLVISAVFLAAALVADTRQHSREAYSMRCSQTRVVEILRAGGFVKDE